MLSNVKLKHKSSARRSRADSIRFETDEALNAPFDFTVEHACQLAVALYEGLNTPTSLGLYLCIKYNDLKSAITHEINPSDYLSGGAFGADWQACKFLSKVSTEVRGLDPESKADETYAVCEDTCQEMNAFWRLYDTCKIELVPEFEKILLRARELILDIIGDGPCYTEWFDSSRLGPGLVAFGPKSTSDYVKLSSDLSVTEELLDFAPNLLDNFPGWIDGLSYSENFGFKLLAVKGGKYAQVPKNAKTHRNIETQPMLNGFLQLGLGQVMRRCLARAGVDLSDQSRNQRLALRGSLRGDLATIDLSNASDLISTGTVSALIPQRWLQAFNLTRTHYCLKDGKWMRLHRFSSMGNGFTFELESLIFYAISRAVCNSKAVVSVYGDDIIVPSVRYYEVVRALKFFGFETNLKKSYHVGLFRESCGHDYFNGLLVRPYFLKEFPSNVPETIGLVNGLYRAASRRNRGYGFDKGFRRVIRAATALIPIEIRNRVAVGFPDDDSYLIGAFQRNGLRILSRVRKVRPSSWYAAKTALLFRQHKREVDKRFAPPRMQLSIRELYDDERPENGPMGMKTVLNLLSKDNEYYCEPYAAPSTELSWPTYGRSTVPELNFI